MVNWSGCLNRNPLYPKGVFDYYPFQRIGLHRWPKLLGFIILPWSGPGFYYGMKMEIRCLEVQNMPLMQTLKCAVKSARRYWSV